jgi:hypothetical protein
LSGFSYDYEEEESNDKKNETMMAGEDDKKSDMMDDDKKEKPVDAVPEPEPVTGKETTWINLSELHFVSLLRSQFYKLYC